MQHRSLHVKTIMFTVIGFHKNSKASIFIHFEKQNFRMHKFLHMLVSDAIFFKTSMKIRFRGSVQQQNPRKLVVNDYQ